MPLVSVIIPAYNAEKFISKTINSVLSQDHHDFEIIIVDDGSTDMTESIILSYVKQSHKVKGIKQNNAGVSAARNNGFKSARGDYVAFLDADDIWESQFLSVLVQLLEKDPSTGLAHSDYREINELGKETSVIKRGKSGNVLNDLLIWKHHVLPPPSGVLIKRSVLEHVGLFDEDLSNNADQDLYIRIAAKYTVARDSRILMNYRQHASGMHWNIAVLERDSLKVYEKAMQQNLFKTLSFRKKCFANMYSLLALNYWAHERNLGKFLEYFGRSVSSYPPVLIQFWKKIIQG